MVSMRVVKVRISVLFDAQMRDVEADIHAFAATYPVLLEGLDTVGPVDEAGEVEEFVGVVGDAEEPLFQVAAGYRRIAPLTLSINDLFVGEHSLVGGAPVDRRVGAVGQARLVESGGKSTGSSDNTPAPWC